MKIATINITPAVAKEMLKKNTRNRPLSIAHVKQLAKSMKNGEWALNGETIKINGDVILDGQHRLSAVVESDTAIMSLVVDGLESEVFDTIDIGKKRSGSDTLAVLGEKNTVLLAATIAMLNVWLNGMNPFTTTTNKDVERILIEHPNIKSSVTFTVANRIKWLNSPVMALCHYLFSTRSGYSHMADGFFNRLVSGADLDKSSPILTLRNRLIENMASKGKMNRRYIMALVIKTWNAYVTGREVKSLRFREEGDSPENFPEPL